MTDAMESKFSKVEKHISLNITIFTCDLIQTAYVKIMSIQQCKFMIEIICFLNYDAWI